MIENLARYGGPRPVFLAVRRLRQDYHEFEASLGYVVSSRPTWATYRNPVQKKKEKIEDLKHMRCYL
jgi:hypothetical protein